MAWMLYVTFLLTQVLTVVYASGLNHTQLKFLAETINVRVKVLDNLRDNERTHVVRITLHNNGSRPIPTSGWRLYFHNFYLLYPDTARVKKSVTLDLEKITVGKIQGDLYYLEPANGFVEIRSGDSRYFDIVSQYWSISRTDFNPNWYLASTDDTVEPLVVNSTRSLDLDHVEPFNDVKQWKRFAADQYNPYTAQERLTRYNVTDSGKADKIILPTPKSINITGGSVNVDNSWFITYTANKFNETAHYLAEKTNLSVSSGTSNLPNTINLQLLPREDTDKHGSYEMSVDAVAKKITLKAADDDGMFYAVQSVSSILDGYNRQNIPGLEVTDEPRYQYRGMFLDVARNFHSIDDVKRLIDAMATYKLNKLHLHLSDDEGWRLEIPGIPELTQVGGNRCHDLQELRCIIPQFGSGPHNDTSGSGYFTVSNYKELLSYAVKNHIQVIPEFDMPGHSHAAIASMKARFQKYVNNNMSAASEYLLHDTNDSTSYMSVQQWTDNAINPCLNSTYDFIAKLMDEVIEMHRHIQPLTNFHFGGDETAENAWQNSSKCQQFLSKNQQYSMPKGLKLYFVQQVSRLAATRNVSLSGWEDAYYIHSFRPMPRNLSNIEYYVYPWNNIWEWESGNHSYQLANAGYKVILSLATNLYFDHPQEPDPNERGLYWATRCTDTKKVLKFMPNSIYDNIFEERSGRPTTKQNICGKDLKFCELLKQPNNIVGMQGQLWSETIKTSADMDYMIYPRLLAVAERAWHMAEFELGTTNVERDSKFQLEWQEFANTLGHKELLRLDKMHIQYRVPPPGGRVLPDGRIEISTTYPGLEIQYSQDSGVTWKSVDKTTHVNWHDQQSEPMLLKTLSADKSRHSRTIQLFKDESVNWSNQDDIDYIADNLDVQVSVITNYKKYNDNYVPIRLTLTNKGDMPIQAGSWKIYFYSMYGARPEPLTCNFTLGHVNGVLYYFEMSNNSHLEISPNATIECTYYNKFWTVSRSDHMPNWYVAATGMTAKVLKSTTDDSVTYVGLFDTPEKWKRNSTDKYDPYIPEVRYDIFQRGEPTIPRYQIIPTPLSMTVDTSKTTQFDAASWVVLNSSTCSFEAKYLAGKLNLTLATTKPKEKYIELITGETDMGETLEAYTLDIDAESKIIKITAKDPAGAMHGVQSLISLFSEQRAEIAKIIVHDKPRFQYRGVMIDTSRNFKPKEWIFKFLDVMSMYKLNKLHFHLTDNEGWRVHLDKIPELTQVAGQRCHTDYSDRCAIPQVGSGPDITTHGSGFYTQKDYEEILRFANERHIEIIPEVDIPGHSMATIAAMGYREELIYKQKMHRINNISESFKLNDASKRRDRDILQKWHNVALNPCLNSTYRFVETVLDEFIRIHKPFQPLKVFHIGGDEVEVDAWVDSPACQPSYSTGQLLRTFVQRVSKLAAVRGLDVAVWDDGVYAEDKPNPISDYNSTVFVYPWDNRGPKIKRTMEFADAGYKVVMPLATYLYFDQAQEPDPEERGLYWAARFIDTKRVFSLLPDDIYANLDYDSFGNKINLDDICNGKPCPRSSKTDNIIGIEAPMWSETARTEAHFHEMGFPRILALAERAWYKAAWEQTSDVSKRNEEKNKAWEQFADVLGYKELQRLEKLDIYYRLSPPGARVVKNTLKANTEFPNQIVEISRDKGATWTNFTDTKLQAGDHSLLMRTKSQNLQRTSRSVVVNVKTSSSNVRTATSYASFSITLVLCIYTSATNLN